MAGGPSCGKSTLLEELAKKGYDVREEVALSIIRQDPSVFHNHPDRFSRMVYEGQRKLEESIKGFQGPIFLDRGFLDCKGYYLARNQKVPEALDHLCAHCDYECVFILEMLPREYWDKTKSGFPRKGTYEQGQLIHMVISRLYRSSGLLVLDIPFLTVPNRAEVVADYAGFLTHPDFAKK